MFNVIRRVMTIAGEDRKSLYLSMVLSIFEGVTLFIPYLLVFYSVNLCLTHTLTKTSITRIAMIMVLSIVVKCIFRRLIDGLQSARALKIFGRERVKFVNHLKKLPMGYFSEDNMGHIISILTTDLIFAEEVAMSFLGQLVASYISIGFSVIFMLVMNPYLTGVYLINVLIAFQAIRYLDRINKGLGKIRQDQLGNLSNSVVEYIKGIPTIKAFSMSSHEEGDLIGAFRETKEKALHFEHKYLLPRILTESSYTLGTGLMILTTLVLYYLGFLKEELALGMLIFSSISLNALLAIINGTSRFGILETVLDRYDAVMNQRVLDTSGTIETFNSFDIEFDSVSFAYDQVDVLKNVSLRIEEGQMTALVGPSGGGKSTVTNLIARFWDVERGEIRIGGTNIKSLSLECLMSNISMVFQNVYLFEDTILNNIAFGKSDATREEVIAAAKRARCHDFIEKLDEGYDTLVGAGGATLSGGEKQRISIARAMLKDAPIILLDEATSSIDPENELYIQEAINELVKNKTLVVIAHRLSSIRGADQILVVDQGKIVEVGTHETLIDYGGVYDRMNDFYTA
jgi:ATP-binding cassette subfamily B protein